MKGLIIRVPAVVNDNTLPKLNEVRMSLIKAGNGSTLSKMQIFTSLDAVKPVKIKSLNGNGLFYSDAAGNALLGSSITLQAVNVIQYVYIKALANDTLIFNNSQNILDFGAGTMDWNPAGGALIRADENAPYVNANIIDIKYLNLLSLSSGITWIGDLAILKDSTSYKWLRPSSVACFGDINFVGNCIGHSGFDDDSMGNYSIDLINISKGLQLYSNINQNNPTATVTYTGGNAKIWGQLNSIAIAANSLTKSMIDSILISMAATGIKYQGLSVISILLPRSVASDAAVTTLRGKGFTVNVNAAT